MRRDLFIRTIRNEESIRRVTTDTAKRFADFARHENASRTRVLVEIGELAKRDVKARRRQIRDGYRRWWKERNVGDWVRDILDGGVARGRLDPSAAGWDDPRSLTPSAWHFVSYRLARIWQTIGEDRRIDEGDLYDAFHYSAACYADIMVTDDKRFLETCDLIDDRPFKPMRLNEFISALP